MLGTRMNLLWVERQEQGWIFSLGWMHGSKMNLIWLGCWKQGYIYSGSNAGSKNNFFVTSNLLHFYFIGTTLWSRNSSIFDFTDTTLRPSSSFNLDFSDTVLWPRSSSSLIYLVRLFDLAAPPFFCAGAVQLSDLVATFFKFAITTLWPRSSSSFDFTGTTLSPHSSFIFLFDCYDFETS